jgi:PAS domain S-box-containing protein
MQAITVRGARILVATDECSVALDLRDRLTHLGCEVTTVCSTEEEAVQRALALHPDLMLIDVGLCQALDGAEAIQHIHDTLDVPVVYLTASAQAATGRLQRPRPFSYLAKPAGEQDLLSAVQGALLQRNSGQQFRENTRWLATVVRSIGDGVIATDAQGRVVLMNPVAEKLTGWREEQAIGRPSADVFDLVRSGTRGRAENPIERALKTGQTVVIGRDCLLVARDGKRIPVDDSAAPICDSAGQPTGAVLVFRDITERQHVEHLLRQHTGELALLNQAAKAFNSSLDLDTVLATILAEVRDILDGTAASIWLLEPEAARMTCRQAVGPHEEIIRNWGLAPGRHSDDWLLCGDSQIVTDTWSDPRCGGSTPGSDQPALRSLLSVPLRSRDAVIGVLQVAAVDADHFSPSDRTLLESLTTSAAIAIENAQLVEKLQERTTELAARNEELDAFAHTVAHDLKSPLGVIMGYSSVLERVLDLPDGGDMPGSELALYLRRIAQTARKMNNIIEELLLLSALRQPEVFIGPVDSAEVVAAAQQRLALMIDQAGATITAADDWPLAFGYAPWLEEVWVNCLSNAIKYGGSPPCVELGAAAQADGTVRFWVRDNGPGIPPEVQARLFTPHTRFHETRATGHGLGLSIVRRIIERLGGRVGVESQPGQGSVFSFTLPGAPPHQGEGLQP